VSMIVVSVIPRASGLIPNPDCRPGGADPTQHAGEFRSSRRPPSGLSGGDAVANCEQPLSRKTRVAPDGLEPQSRLLTG